MWQQIGFYSVAGGVIGSVIGFFASRKSEAKIEKAHQRLVGTLEETITRERDEKEQLRTRAHALANNTATLEKQIVELESRPDVSSMTAVLERNTNVMSHVADSLEKQNNTLDGRTILFTEIRQAFQATRESIESHDKRVEQRFVQLVEKEDRRFEKLMEPIKQMCEQVTEAVTTGIRNGHKKPKRKA